MESGGWSEESDHVEYEDGTATKLSNDTAVAVSRAVSGQQYLELKIGSVGDALCLGITDNPDIDDRTPISKNSDRIWSYSDDGRLFFQGEQIGKLQSLRKGDSVGFLIDTGRPVVLVYRNKKLLTQLPSVEQSSLYLLADMGFRGDSVTLSNSKVTEKHEQDLGLGSRNANAPGSPDISGKAISPTQIEVKWSFEDIGGSAITRQLIYLSPDAGVNWHTPMDLGRNRQGLISGLQANTEYIVWMKGKNFVGWGKPSDRIKIRTLAPVRPTRPDLFATAIAPNSFSVEWDLPSFEGGERPGDGGAAVLNYQLQWCEASSGSDYNWDRGLDRTESVVYKRPDDRTFSLERLRPGAGHSVRVRAQNRAGWGQWAVLDLCTAGYSEGTEVSFLWDGPWSKCVEWHRGTVEEVVRARQKQKQQQQGRSQAAAAAPSFSVFEDQAGFGPPVLGTSKMQGLLYLIRSEEYPEHLVQVQVEKMRVRWPEDTEFSHTRAETERILQDQYS